jgi:lysophospholipase L1-like esterase
MFTFDQIMTPIWDTDVVFGESLTMYRDKNGDVSAGLLYSPIEIIEVRSASLEIPYTEGKDYFLKDGRLCLTENTSVPFMEYEDIYMPEKKHDACFAYPDGYLLFHEGHFFHDRQIAVTYKCQKGEWKGYRPSFEGDRLKKTLKKLTEEKKLKLILFGDSISAGANASGLTMASPFQPSFGALLAENLRRKYGARVDYENPSVGGKNSDWAADVLDDRVISRNPDLVILAFGMNDKCEPDEFLQKTKNMVNRIKAANADTEIILIATSTPNPLLTSDKAKFYRYQHLYGKALSALVEDGVALLDIGALQAELHRKKRFIDTTGNNVNHPCDFFIRIHAQALCSMLIKNTDS